MREKVDASKGNNNVTHLSPHLENLFAELKSADKQRAAAIRAELADLILETAVTA